MKKEGEEVSSLLNKKTCAWASTRGGKGRKCEWKRRKKDWEERALQCHLSLRGLVLCFMWEKKTKSGGERKHFQKWLRKTSKLSDPGRRLEARVGGKQEKARKGKLKGVTGSEKKRKSLSRGGPMNI